MKKLALFLFFCVLSLTTFQVCAVSSTFDAVKEKVALKVEKLDSRDCKKLFK